MTKELYDSFASDSEAFQYMLTMGDVNMNKAQEAISVFVKGKEKRVVTLFVKDNETYNDVIKEAAEIAKINGFEDYYITANFGAVDVWEK